METLATREKEIATWNPVRELQEMSNRMSRLFSTSLWGRQGLLPDDEESLTAGAAWAPAVNVSEQNNHYCITADLPGVEKKDVHVTMQDGLLTIQGERRRQKEEKGERFHRVESFYGSFLRRFTMPDDADPEHIDAKLEKGRLEIHIHKVPAKKRPRPTEIPVG